MALGRLCLHGLGLEAEPPKTHSQSDSGNEAETPGTRQNEARCETPGTRQIKKVLPTAGILAIMGDVHNNIKGL